MALITCPDCGGKVSDKANVCIHCGYPINDNDNIGYVSRKSVAHIMDEVLDECERKRWARQVHSPFPLVWNF